MAKVVVNGNRNYDVMSDEPFWNENKDKAKEIRKFNGYRLYSAIANNENNLFILADKDDNYIASIEMDSENHTKIDGKKGIFIDAGYSKVRGGYSILLDALLLYTDNKFIMSDLSLSDRAAKFWSKYVEAINSSKYKAVLYNAKTKEVIPYDGDRAFSYDGESDNKNNHIGIMK